MRSSGWRSSARWPPPAAIAPAPPGCWASASAPSATSSTSPRGLRRLTELLRPDPEGTGPDGGNFFRQLFPVWCSRAQISAIARFPPGSLSHYNCDQLPHVLEPRPRARRNRGTPIAFDLGDGNTHSERHADQTDRRRDLQDRRRKR